MANIRSGKELLPLRFTSSRPAQYTTLQVTNDGSLHTGTWARALAAANGLRLGRNLLGGAWPSGMSAVCGSDFTRCCRPGSVRTTQRAPSRRLAEARD